MSNGIEMSLLSPNQDLLPSLLDLNDDCLLKVIEYLDVVDLSTVRKTCKRFRQLSEYYFRMQYFDKPILLQKENNRETRTYYAKVKRALKRFGRHIHKIIFRSKDADSALYLELIHAHSKPHRPEIEFNDMCIDSFDVSTWQNLLSNIQRLSFKACRGDDYYFGECLDECRSLKELEVIGFHGDFTTVFNRRIGQLETIVQKNFTELCYHCDDSFFNRNRKLKKVVIIDRLMIPDIYFSRMVSYLKNVEEICFKIYFFSCAPLEELLSGLLELKKLKRLEFNCKQRQITSFVCSLAAKNTMEHFGICDAELNEQLCHALTLMKSLKTLKLISMQNECQNFAKELSQHLPQLEEFYIVESNTFTIKDALEIIENASNLNRLVIKNCSRFTVDYKDHTRLEKLWKQRHGHKILTIYVDQSVLDAAKEEIPESLFQEGVECIKLRSTLLPEIQSVDLITKETNFD